VRPARILLVDDDEDLRRTLAPHLEDLGNEVLAVESAESALNHVAQFEPDLVFSDVQMSGMNGFELLARLREACPQVDVVIFTGFGGVQGAIDAIKEGASDYLLKPLDLDEIEGVIERCMRDRSARPPGKEPKAEPAPAPGGMVGRHPSMLNVYKTIGAVAPTRAVVLIQGETGTGKELIARTIHENSAAADEPFIAINCAAVPETLLESTLFGHVRGAFTGASSDRRGPFELAGRGTVFLDEIGETPLAFQAKLLRVLEEREYYPVGSEFPRRTEARVLAATNRDLAELVRTGAFREDLLFRLKVVDIVVAPLRQRRSDIPLLVRHILSKAAEELGKPVPTVPPEVMACLISRDWPGNVRELENTLVRALVMSRGPALSVRDIEGSVWRSPSHDGAEGGKGSGALPEDPKPGNASLAEVERNHVQRVLFETDGNKSAAARLLEVSRPTLNRIIKDYDLILP
jgi:DNA-binding NtrC family response regulator